MAEHLGAVLVAEIGSLITRVTLVDQVEGETRLVGHYETSSSLEPPYANVLYSVLEGAAHIAEMTGRQLLRDGQLLIPQNNESDGINQLVAVSSAAGALTMVITAISSDLSARSAIHVSRSTYTALLQVVTLDDAAEHPVVSAHDRSWIERQVETLLSLQPDSVLIAGGLEDGAVSAVNRLAHIVGLTTFSSTGDTRQQRRQQTTVRPVIYAGNSAAREQVIEALSDRAEIFVVDNLRPTLEQGNLAPARQELARLYARQTLPRLPGYDGLSRLCRVPVRTVCDVEQVMARFLAERSRRHVLVADVGAAASALFYAAPGRIHPAVLGTTGTVYGLSNMLSAEQITAISRWLPFPIDPVVLNEQLLNRILHPHGLPVTRQDLYLDHALAREALHAVAVALRDETSDAGCDWIVASGGVLAHAPEPGMALLTLLDALEPTGMGEHPVVDITLDSLGLLTVAGALAPINADAVITLTDRDLLHNQPLASVVTLLGEGREGEVAAEVELTILGRQSEQIVVHHGELARLRVPPGRYGRLTIKPAQGVRVGTATAGEVVASEGGDVAGSVLGLVIDARGRPLRLPTDTKERCTRLWKWLVALGVEKGPNPYLAMRDEAAPAAHATPAPVTPKGTSAEPIASATTAPLTVGGSEVVSSGDAGKRTSLDSLRMQESAEAPPVSLTDERDKRH